MVPTRVHSAATRSIKHPLALLLALILSVSSTLAHAQQATPISDTGSIDPGTITIHSAHEISGLQFRVIDHQGFLLESGVLDQTPYESPLLVTTPGSIAYLSLWDGFGNFLSESETMANTDGSLHFVVDLTLDPMLQQNSVEPEPESGMFQSLQSVDLVEFKVIVDAHRFETPLPNHQVHLILDGEVIQTVRTDQNGESLFLVEPGTYAVRVDPYATYLGRSVESVTVDSTTPPLKFTLRRADYSGWLTIKTSLIRYDSPTVSITNPDGITIAEGQLEPSTAGIAFAIPHSSNYTIRISGNQDWEPTVVSGISFASASATEVIETRPRPKANMEITLTVPQGHELPQTALMTLSLPGWEQQVMFTNQNGILQQTLSFGTGDVQYRLTAPGFTEISGVLNHKPGPKGRFGIELVPETLTETPTETPSETPVETPSETPTETPEVTPSETPTETPVETPSETPTETPDVTPSETPTETPEVTPSETPAETPDVTPSETPTETPDVTPSETPTETPEVTPSETPAETPDVTPSETPTETPDVTPSETPDVTPSETPTETPDVTPSETPTETPDVTPSETPVETPSETPTETPDVTPSETPTETPEVTPSETPTETPDVAPSETPTETPEVTPSETPIETPDVTPSETPSETPTETPEETPTETPDVTPSETPTETPVETPSETPTETPDVTPSETPTETPEVTPSETPTETPDVAPSETPNEPPEISPTETPNNPVPNNETIIRLSLPGNASVAGAPYSVYAPVASQFMAEPYLRGVVGQENTISLPGLIPATYRIVVEAESLPTIDFIIAVNDQELTEAHVVMDETGTVTVSYQAQIDPTQTPPATTPNADDLPDEAPTNTETASDPGSNTTVTGLPETGTHTRINDQSWITPALILAAFTSTLPIIAGITGSRSNNRKL